MKKILLIYLSFIGIILYNQNVFALGVTANTNIISLGTSINITAKNTFGAVMAPVNGNASFDHTQAVAPMYGFQLYTYVPSERLIARGQATQYVFAFMNRSNTTMDIQPTQNTLFSGNLGGPWTATLNYGTTNSIGINQIFSSTLNIQTDAQALDMAKSLSTLQFIFTNGTNFGAYTGFNNSRYGGIAIFNHQVTTSIAAADVSYISKTITVINAPTANNYRGGDVNYGYDPVPGSILEYALVVRNLGSGDSAVIDITEIIPTNSVFLNIPSNSDILENSSTLGANNDVDYDSNGTFNLGAPINSYAGRSAVNQIRFRLSGLTAGVTKTLRYRVTVKDPL